MTAWCRAYEAELQLGQMGQIGLLHVSKLVAEILKEELEHADLFAPSFT